MIRGERAYDRCIRVPAATGRLHNLASFDAGRAMIDCSSNLAHLCTESVRHLVDDPGFDLDTLSANNLGDLDADIANDATLPSVPGVLHSWQQIGWSQWTARRWGPFTVSADEGDRAVSATPRKVRVIVEVVFPTSDQAQVCAAITRGSSVDEIYAGHPLAVDEITSGLTGGGLKRLVFDLEPTAIVDATYPADRSVLCSGTGATTHVVRTFYVWLGFAIWRAFADTIEVVSVNAYELR